MSEGTVFQRSDGRWCAKYKDARGSWRYLYRKSKGEARKALRVVLKDRDECTQPRETEHLTLRIVCLYQPVAVEEGCLASIEFDLPLLVAHPWQEAQGHPPGSYLLAISTTTAA
jgi:hypothetical protein